MPTLQDRLAAAERQQAEAKAKAAELRKQIRQQGRKRKLEEERKARIARQSRALEILDWLESHDFKSGGLSVNAYEFVVRAMNAGADCTDDSASADSSSGVTPASGDGYSSAIATDIF